MDYPVVVVDTDKLLDSVDNSEHLEVFSPAKEGDAIFDTEFNKVRSLDYISVFTSIICLNHHLQ